MPDATTRRCAILFLAVFAIAVTFAAYTNHAWEDYWITFRASHNLATGHGLVYKVGDRLHTFTSPLGTLLPAGLSWVTGNESDQTVLWLFRFVSMTAFASGMVLVFLGLTRLHKNRLSTWLAVSLLGLDAKTVDFSINGMETGFLFFFLALTFHGFFVAGRRQAWRIGIGWGGLMWTRPDSCIYIAALALAAFIFSPNAMGGQSRKDLSKKIFPAGIICTILYLPWFAWAWSYYGSPVPHTIIAKGTNLPGISPFGLVEGMLLSPVLMLKTSAYARWVFLPTYAWFGGWTQILPFIGLAFALVAAFIWVVPRVQAHTRTLSFTFFLGLFFLDHIVKVAFPWYLPPVAFFGYLTISCIFDELLSLARFGGSGAHPMLRGMTKFLPGCAFALIAGQTLVTLGEARQMEVQQRLIEDGMRRQIGLWLRANAHSTNDTVYLEPLGYIGYFSRLKMFDSLGLSSREVVEIRRRLGPENQNQVYLELKPDWLVLRPIELKKAKIIDPQPLPEYYDLVKIFDAGDEILATRWLPGKNYLLFDQAFLVYHRKNQDGSAPSPTGDVH